MTSNNIKISFGINYTLGMLKKNPENLNYFETVKQDFDNNRINYHMQTPSHKKTRSHSSPNRTSSISDNIIKRTHCSPS